MERWSKSEIEVWIAEDAMDRFIQINKGRHLTTKKAGTIAFEMINGRTGEIIEFLHESIVFACDVAISTGISDFSVYAQSKSNLKRTLVARSAPSRSSISVSVSIRGDVSGSLSVEFLCRKIPNQREKPAIDSLSAEAGKGMILHLSENEVKEAFKLQGGIAKKLANNFFPISPRIGFQTGNVLLHKPPLSAAREKDWVFFGYGMEKLLIFSDN